MLLCTSHQFSGLAASLGGKACCFVWVDFLVICFFALFLNVTSLKHLVEVHSPRLHLRIHFLYIICLKSRRALSARDACRLVMMYLIYLFRLSHSSSSIEVIEASGSVILFLGRPILLINLSRASLQLTAVLSSLSTFEYAS